MNRNAQVHHRTINYVKMNTALEGGVQWTEKHCELYIKAMTQPIVRYSNITSACSYTQLLIEEQGREQEVEYQLFSAVMQSLAVSKETVTMWSRDMMRLLFISEQLVKHDIHIYVASYTVNTKYLS